MGMPTFQEKATVQALEQLSPENYRLTLHSPLIADTARPGQFVMVSVGPGKDPLLRRPFSFHHVGPGGLIQILFKVVGRGTELLSHMIEGGKLSILGPLGNGFVLDPRKNACLVGGGMGIAPIRFLAEKLAHEKERKDDSIILGGRNSEELKSLVMDFDGLGAEVHLVTDDGTLGTHGVVTDVLVSLGLSSESVLYCCGPKPMLFAVHKYARDNGIRCQVSIESVMACGMGACLGCSVPAASGGYVHVCDDGPVFDANTLTWLI